MLANQVTGFPKTINSPKRMNLCTKFQDSIKTAKVNYDTILEPIENSDKIFIEAKKQK